MCWLHLFSYYLVFIMISYLLFLKAHFPIKPNASLLGKICSPVGQRITSWPCLGIPKKTYSWASHFHLEKKLISGLDIWPGLDGPHPTQLIACSPLNNNKNNAKKNSAVLTPQKHKYCSSCLVPAVGRTLCNFLVYWLHRLTMVWDRDVRKPGGSKKNSCT